MATTQTTTTTQAPRRLGGRWIDDWRPEDLDFWNVRWVAMHLVEELTRHAGHCDIIRESIDGATMYELMAAILGWPETDWIKPWRKSA